MTSEDEFTAKIFVLRCTESSIVRQLSRKIIFYSFCTHARPNRAAQVRGKAQGGEDGAEYHILASISSRL